MGLFNKIFGTYSEKEVKRVIPIVERINNLEDSISKLSDDKLKNKTLEFKERLSKGETLDEILPEAFAVVREASKRVLGMRHFDVQLIGGIILHQGRIAEMKTGEGKTLVATLPVYLNALTGKGVHVVTVNDYLAKRDSEWMGKLYKFLGLSVGLVIAGMNSNQKQEAYNADITYGTNNEYGFDYLRDNMVIYKNQMVQRPLNYAIVDEIDSILIDEARTPLIISGAGEDDTYKYHEVDKYVGELTEVAKEEQSFASLIIAGTIDHIDEIDALIESHLAANWSKDRINKVTLAILRTSVYEMKYQSNGQPGIIIDEAVNIAKDYGADDSFKFINAVLDKIGKNDQKA